MMNTPAKIQKAPPLREQVAENLRIEILSGHFSTDERLTEVKVATYLGVSRTPVREALGLLAQQGILRVRSGGGYELFTPSIEEILEVFEMRELLEVYAIQSVARQSNTQHLKELKNEMDTLKTAHEEDNAGEFAIHNFIFRKTLFRVCNNSLAKKTLAEFDNHMHYIARVTLKNPKTRELVMVGQENIYQALTDHDVSQAIDVIVTNLKTAKMAMLQSIGTLG